MESNYDNTHALDDPDLETNPEPANKLVPTLAVLAVLLVIGVYLLGQWLRPPTVVFQAPRVPWVQADYVDAGCTNGSTCSVTLSGGNGGSTFASWTGCTTVAQP